MALKDRDNNNLKDLLLGLPAVLGLVAGGAHVKKSVDGFVNDVNNRLSKTEQSVPGSGSALKSAQQAMIDRYKEVSANIDNDVAKKAETIATASSSSSTIKKAIKSYTEREADFLFNSLKGYGQLIPFVDEYSGATSVLSETTLEKKKKYMQGKTDEALSELTEALQQDLKQNRIIKRNISLLRRDEYLGVLNPLYDTLDSTIRGDTFTIYRDLEKYLKENKLSSYTQRILSDKLGLDKNKVDTILSVSNALNNAKTVTEDKLEEFGTLFKQITASSLENRDRSRAVALLSTGIDIHGAVDTYNRHLPGIRKMQLDKNLDYINKRDIPNHYKFIANTSEKLKKAAYAESQTVTTRQQLRNVLDENRMDISALQEVWDYTVSKPGTPGSAKFPGSKDYTDDIFDIFNELKESIGGDADALKLKVEVDREYHGRARKIVHIVSDGGLERGKIDLRIPIEDAGYFASRMGINSQSAGLILADRSRSHENLRTFTDQVLYNTKRFVNKISNDWIQDKPFDDINEFFNRKVINPVLESASIVDGSLKSVHTVGKVHIKPLNLLMGRGDKWQYESFIKGYEGIQTLLSTQYKNLEEWIPLDIEFTTPGMVSEAKGSISWESKDTRITQIAYGFKDKAGNVHQRNMHISLDKSHKIHGPLYKEHLEQWKLFQEKLVSPDDPSVVKSAIHNTTRADIAKGEFDKQGDMWFTSDMFRALKQMQDDILNSEFSGFLGHNLTADRNVLLKNIQGLPDEQQAILEPLMQTLKRGEGIHGRDIDTFNIYKTLMSGQSSYGDSGEGAFKHLFGFSVSKWQEMGRDTLKSLNVGSGISIEDAIMNANVDAQTKKNFLDPVKSLRASGLFANDDHLLDVLDKVTSGKYHQADVDQVLEASIAGKLLHQIRYNKKYDKRDLAILEATYEVALNHVNGINDDWTHPIDVIRNHDLYGDVFGNDPITRPEYNGLFVSAISSSQSQAAKGIGNIIGVESMTFGALTGNLARQKYQAITGHAVDSSIQDTIARDRLGPLVKTKSGAVVGQAIDRSLVESRAFLAMNKQAKQQLAPLYRNGVDAITMNPNIRLAFLDPRIKSIEEEQLRLVTQLQADSTGKVTQKVTSGFAFKRTHDKGVRPAGSFVDYMKTELGIENNALLNHFRRLNYSVAQIDEVLDQGMVFDTLSLLDANDRLAVEDVHAYLKQPPHRRPRSTVSDFHMRPDSIIYRPGKESTRAALGLDNAEDAFLRNVRVSRKLVNGEYLYDFRLDTLQTDRGAGGSKYIAGGSSKIQKVYSTAGMGDVNVSNFLNIGGKTLSSQERLLSSFIIPDMIGGTLAMKVKKEEAEAFFTLQVNRVVDFLNRTESNPLKRKKTIRKVIEAGLGAAESKGIYSIGTVGAHNMSTVDWLDIRKYNYEFKPFEASIEMLKAAKYGKEAAKLDFMERHRAGATSANPIFADSPEQLESIFEEQFAKQKKEIKEGIKGNRYLEKQLDDATLESAVMYDIILRKQNKPGGDGLMQALRGALVAPVPLRQIETTTMFNKRYRSLYELRDKLPPLYESNLSGFQSLYITNQVIEASAAIGNGKAIGKHFDSFIKRTGFNFQLKDGRRPLQELFEAGTEGLRLSLGLISEDKLNRIQYLSDKKDGYTTAIKSFVETIKESPADSTRIIDELNRLKSVGSDTSRINQLKRELGVEGNSAFSIPKGTVDFNRLGSPGSIKDPSLLYKVDIPKMDSAVADQIKELVGEDTYKKVEAFYKLKTPHGIINDKIKNLIKKGRIDAKNAEFFKDFDSFFSKGNASSLSAFYLVNPMHNLGPIQIDDKEMIAGTSLRFYNALKGIHAIEEFNNSIKAAAEAGDSGKVVKLIESFDDKNKLNTIFSKNILPLYEKSINAALQGIHRNYTPVSYHKMQNVHQLANPLMSVLSDSSMRSTTKSFTIGGADFNVNTGDLLRRLAGSDGMPYDTVLSQMKASDGLGFRGMGVGESLVSLSAAKNQIREDLKHLTGTKRDAYIERAQRWLSGQEGRPVTFGRAPGTVEMLAPSVNLFVAPDEAFQKSGFTAAEIADAQKSVIYWEPLSAKIKGADWDGDLGFRFFTDWYKDGMKNEIKWYHKRVKNMLEEGLIDGFSASDFNFSDDRITYKHALSSDAATNLSMQLGQMMPSNILNGTSMDFLGRVTRKSEEVMALKLSTGYFGRLHNKMIAMISGPDAFSRQVYNAIQASPTPSSIIDKHLGTDVDSFVKAYDRIENQLPGGVESLKHRLTVWHGGSVEKIGIKKDKTTIFTNSDILDNINAVYSDIRNIMYSDDTSVVGDSIERLIERKEIETSRLIGSGSDTPVKQTRELLKDLNKVLRGTLKFSKEYGVGGPENSWLEKKSKMDESMYAWADALGTDDRTKWAMFYNRNIVSGGLSRAGYTIENPFAMGALLGKEHKIASSFESPIKTRMVESMQSAMKYLSKNTAARKLGLAVGGLMLFGGLNPTIEQGGAPEWLPSDLGKTVSTHLTNPTPAFVDKIYDSMLGDSTTPDNMNRANRQLPPRPHIRSAYQNNKVGNGAFRA